MFNLLFLLLIFTCFPLTLLHPQESLASSIPQLGLIFPIEEKGENVVLTQDCLINKNTILEKGTILYTLYAMPTASDVDVKIETQKIRRKEAYAVNKELETNAETPEKMALRKRALNTKWTSHLVFRAMLNRVQYHDLNLVFEIKNSKLGIEALDFPEGLFISNNSDDPNKIEILWIDPLADGAKAGFQIGDQILSFNQDSITSLSSFKDHYLSSKTSLTPINIEVQSSSNSKPRILILKPPSTLSGSLLDQY